jgi:hypothetical protein
MTLPEGVQPSGPTETPTVEDDTAATEPVTTDEDTTVEDATDAELRAWARDNGIEGVPASGRLSATWREQITAAMTAALDPKEEGSAEATTPESSTSVEETTTETDTPDGESPSPSTESEPVVEYRSVFQPPNTFVDSQTFTS